MIPRDLSTFPTKNEVASVMFWPNMRVERTPGTTLYQGLRAYLPRGALRLYEWTYPPSDR